MRCHMRRMYLASGMVDEENFDFQTKIVNKPTKYHETIRKLCLNDHNHFEFQNLKYLFQFYSIKFDIFKENETQFHQTTEKLGFRMQINDLIRDNEKILKKKYHLEKSKKELLILFMNLNRINYFNGVQTKHERSPIKRSPIAIGDLFSAIGSRSAIVI